MEFIKTDFEDLYLIDFFEMKDNRGKFIKPWYFEDNNNLSEIYCTTSKKGTIRGLHYQESDSAQKKQVTCLSGIIEDISLDMRKNSPTYGKIFRYILNSSNNTSILIPHGFAHAIYAHEDSIVMTCCDKAFNPTSEKGINWMSLDDLSDLNVLEISEKDRALPSWDLLNE